MASPVPTVRHLIATSLVWPSLLALASCGAGQAGANGPVAAMPNAAVVADWRKIATDADRDRLRRWRSTWVEALTKARRAGEGGNIAAQGQLLDPDHAIDGPLPPPGDYRCRVFKLGANGPAMREFTAHPWFACRISREGDVSGFAKVGGTQRPVGLIFPDGPARAIFLGTLAIGDESGVMSYGRDAARDLAGIVERVDDRRWRIAMPLPRYESMVDVIELVPAG